MHTVFSIFIYNFKDRDHKEVIRLLAQHGAERGGIANNRHFSNQKLTKSFEFTNECIR